MLWKVIADPHPLAAITGSPRFIRPTLCAGSSREEAAGGSLNYPCCTLPRKHPRTGCDERSRRLARPIRFPIATLRRRTNSEGTQLHAPGRAPPSGLAPIDSTRRVHLRGDRRRLHRTGAKTTDAVMAIDWDRQGIVRQSRTPKTMPGSSGAPRTRLITAQKSGPDFDFGTPPILRTLPDGRRVLVAGQKSGKVFAHNPDRPGTVSGTPSSSIKLGDSEILFGGPPTNRLIFRAWTTASSTALDPTGQAGVVFAVASRPKRRGTNRGARGLSRRRVLRRRDGTFRAFFDRGRSDGLGLQHAPGLHDRERPPARGGSMGSPGPVFAGGMLFVAFGICRDSETGRRVTCCSPSPWTSGSRSSRRVRRGPRRTRIC